MFYLYQIISNLSYYCMSYRFLIFKEIIIQYVYQVIEHDIGLSNRSAPDSSALATAHRNHCFNLHFFNQLNDTCKLRPSNLIITLQQLLDYLEGFHEFFEKILNHFWLDFSLLKKKFKYSWKSALWNFRDRKSYKIRF